MARAIEEADPVISKLKNYLDDNPHLSSTVEKIEQDIEAKRQEMSELRQQYGPFNSKKKMRSKAFNDIKNLRDEVQELEFAKMLAQTHALLDKHIKAGENK